MNSTTAISILIGMMVGGEIIMITFLIYIINMVKPVFRYFYPKQTPQKQAFSMPKFRFEVGQNNKTQQQNNTQIPQQQYTPYQDLTPVEDTHIPQPIQTYEQQNYNPIPPAPKKHTAWEDKKQNPEWVAMMQQRALKMRAAKEAKKAQPQSNINNMTADQLRAMFQDKMKNG